MKKTQHNAGFALAKHITAAGVIALLAITAVMAADLSYTTLPQDNDSELVIAHKAAVAAARSERGDAFLYVSTAGTNSVSGPVTLGKLVVGTGGTNSTVTLNHVAGGATNAIATVTSTSTVALDFNIRLSGSLQVVNAGDTPANVTITYR